MLAGKLVFISGRLLVAGMFVFITGTLLMADILVVPPIVLLAPLILELVAEVSVELLGLLWLQPASTSAARTVIADSVIIDFISSLFHICCRQRCFRFFRLASLTFAGKGAIIRLDDYFFMAVICCKCDSTTGMDLSRKLLISASCVAADSALKALASFLWPLIMATT